MNYTVTQVIENLDIDRSTFYRYIQNNETLRQLRQKKKNKYFYTDLFIKEFKTILKNKTVAKAFKTETTVETIIEKNTETPLLSELKTQYENRIDDLKSQLDRSQDLHEKDKNYLQNELKSQILKNSEQTNKVETLLLQLLKITNENSMLENNTKTDEENIKEKNIDSEKVIIEVQQNIEKSKKDNETKDIKVETLTKQLESANNQAKQYKNFKNEKDSLIEDLKKEYNRTKFFQILKKSKLKKDIEKAYSKQFEFIHYVV